MKLIVSKISLSKKWNKVANWVSFPKPRLLDSMYQREDLSKITLNNNEPVFDVKNILRCNNDILYLVSNTGNLKGVSG